MTNKSVHMDVSLRGFKYEEFDIAAWHDNIQRHLNHINSTLTVQEYLDSQKSMLFHPEQQRPRYFDDPEWRIFVMEYNHDDN